MEPSLPGDFSHIRSVIVQPALSAVRPPRRSGWYLLYGRHRKGSALPPGSPHFSADTVSAVWLRKGSMCLVCGLITVKRRLHGKKEKIPFPVGPFLAAGAAAAYFMKIGGLIL